MYIFLSATSNVLYANDSIYCINKFNDKIIVNKNTKYKSNPSLDTKGYTTPNIIV